MKAFVLAAVAALCVSAAPAMAQDFTGARVGVVGGYDDVHSRDGVTYGGVVGVDAPIAKGVTLGAEATLEDSTAKTASRELGLAVRAGVVVAPKMLVFGKVGYTNARFNSLGNKGTATFEGLRYGGGVEYALTKHAYTTVEYRRSQYEAGRGGRDGVLAGVGFRF